MEGEELARFAKAVRLCHVSRIGRAELARNHDKSISIHHHHNMPRMYRSDRSELVWLPREIEALCHDAPEAARRIAIAASIGGLRPGDLGLLKLVHVEDMPTGRRIYFKTSKRGRVINIPVTAALGEERYAALVPEVADKIRRKLDAFRDR